MDKKRKKELQEQYAKQEKEKFINSLPFSVALFKELFDYLDDELENGCDDTLKFTEKFLKNNKLPLEKSIKWMQDNGGYCDCEVLANIEYSFENL